MATLDPLFSFQLLGGKLIFASDDDVLSGSSRGKFNGGAEDADGIVEEYSEELQSPPFSADSPYLSTYLSGASDPEESGETNEERNADPDRTNDNSEPIEIPKEEISSDDVNEMLDATDVTDIADIFGGDSGGDSGSDADDYVVAEIFGGEKANLSDEEKYSQVFGLDTDDNEQISGAGIFDDDDIVPEQIDGGDRLDPYEYDEIEGAIYL